LKFNTVASGKYASHEAESATSKTKKPTDGDGRMPIIAWPTPSAANAHVSGVESAGYSRPQSKFLRNSQSPTDEPRHFDWHKLCF
jgi:hypothetical protein